MKLFACLTLIALFGFNAFAAPKYPADVVPLSKDHAFLQKNAAPDYWALSPYYVSQYNGAACSDAAYTMILNGARSQLALGSEDKLVTQHMLAEQFKDKPFGKLILGAETNTKYAELFAKGEKVRSPMLIREHPEMSRAFFAKNGFEVTESELVNVKVLDDATKKKVRDLLVKNEKSADDFIVLDFVQGKLTDDPEGMEGHVSVVGAFDAAQNRVLVMDPDREWYEPYWVSFDRLLSSLHETEKSTGDYHGIYYVKVKPIKK